MAKKKLELSELEVKFIEGMRKRPQMGKRMEAILAMSQSVEGEIKSADEIEGMLIEEVRRLGAATMEEWAEGAEQVIGQAHQKKNPGSYSAKKRTEMVGSFRLGGGRRADLASGRGELRTSVRESHRGESPREVGTAGARAQRFWN